MPQRDPQFTADSITVETTEYPDIDGVTPTLLRNVVESKVEGWSEVAKFSAVYEFDDIVLTVRPRYEQEEVGPVRWELVISPEENQFVEAAKEVTTNTGRIKQEGERAVETAREALDGYE